MTDRNNNHFRQTKRLLEFCVLDLNDTLLQLFFHKDIRHSLVKSDHKLQRSRRIECDTDHHAVLLLCGTNSNNQPDLIFNLLLVNPKFGLSCLGIDTLTASDCCFWASNCCLCICSPDCLTLSLLYRVLQPSLFSLLYFVLHILSSDFSTTMCSMLQWLMA